MAKRVVKSRAARATEVRCGWCGKMFKPRDSKKGKRIPKHKADRDWEYRDDNLCPGSLVLIKNLAPKAITTRPDGKGKPKKKVVKRGKATRRKR